MSDLEKRVRTAFDAVSAPDALVERTLSAIEAERGEEAGFEEAPQAVHSAMGSDAPKSESKFVSPAVRLAAKRHRKMRMIAAASLAAVLVCGSASAVYASESAYVEVSGDASLELAVNRFGIVVRCSSLDQETQARLDESGVVGKTYEDALDALIEHGMAFGSAEEGSVEFLVTCSNEGQCERLEQTTAKCLEEGGVQNGSCSEASEEERAEALANGMGISKYRAYEELKALGSDVTAEECRSMSMKELREAIAEAEGTSANGSSQGANAGNGGGSGLKATGSNGSSAQNGGSGHGPSNTDEKSGSGTGNGYSHGQGAGRSEHGNGGGQG